MSNPSATPPAEAGEDALARPVDTLAGVGPKRAQVLARLGIRAIGDLQYNLPSEYRDWRRCAPIESLAEGMEATVSGEVVSSRNIRMRGRMSMAEVVVSDGTGEVKATFFGRGFLARALQPGKRLVMTGTVGTYKGLALKNPEYEILDDSDETGLNTGRIVPVYPLTEDLSQRLLRRLIADALAALPEDAPDPLPEETRARYNFPPFRDALNAVHFPEEDGAWDIARDRFVYEEFLRIQQRVGVARRKRREEEHGCAHTVDGQALAAYRDALPFPLTAAQTRVVGEILGDMASTVPMARLLQGDVGSGKTAVAMHAIAAAADGGFQAALMAPTELLAEQHLQLAKQWLAPCGLKCVLLTGATVGAKALRRDIKHGFADLVVGTHALFQEATAFKNLGLVIVDEQHRFGVGQREALRAKGTRPDLLHMTATPIPRSLVLTAYGAMDLSVIDELPPGRTPVRTERMGESDLPELYAYIHRQAQKGLQTYYVCPLVESSETLTLNDVISTANDLADGPLKGLRLGLVHGRLRPQEKEAVMNAFASGTLDVLVATSVIEVGINVPTATTMVIEDAGQFGMTQLHQLRGRVGRGDEASRCFLLGAPSTTDGVRRLEVLCGTNDGFAIAEEDLRLRGPGEVFGNRQTGFDGFRIANPIQDAEWLERATQDANTEHGA